MVHVLAVRAGRGHLRTMLGASFGATPGPRPSTFAEDLVRKGLETAAFPPQVEHAIHQVGLRLGRIRGRSGALLAQCLKETEREGCC